MNKYIEQAYYLGYQDGDHDGYHSSLIEEGRCGRKNSMNDLPNVNLVSLDEVLEAIDKELHEFSDFICKDVPDKDEESIRVLTAMIITRCKDVVLALKGEQE